MGLEGILFECFYQLSGIIPKKHLSRKTEVSSPECGIVNSHAGTGTSISNFIFRRS